MDQKRRHLPKSLSTRLLQYFTYLAKQAVVDRILVSLAGAEQLVPQVIGQRELRPHAQSVVKAGQLVFEHSEGRVNDRFRGLERSHEFTSPSQYELRKTEASEITINGIPFEHDAPHPDSP
eukprot:2143550-Pleurochrysis_carterae.AAC.1